MNVVGEFYWAFAHARMRSKCVRCYGGLVG